jgi:hypothetical protein
MDKRFLEALIHREHSVLGYKLNPYCLAHIITLEAIDHPVASNGIFASGIDILLFLKVCSSAAFKPNLSLSFLDKLKVKYLNTVEPARIRALQAISKFLEDFGSMPEITSKGDGTGKKLTAPWALSRVAGLHTNTNLTEYEIYNNPIGYLYWLDCAVSEYKGAEISFFDPENPMLTTADIEMLRKEAAKPMPEVDEGISPEEFWTGTRKENAKFITPQHKKTRGTKQRRRQKE